jgi:hypothetical protein
MVKVNKDVPVFNKDDAIKMYCGVKLEVHAFLTSTALPPTATGIYWIDVWVGHRAGRRGEEKGVSGFK